MLTEIEFIKQKYSDCPASLQNQLLQLIFWFFYEEKHYDGLILADIEVTVQFQIEFIRVISFYIDDQLVEDFSA